MWCGQPVGVRPPPQTLTKKKGGVGGVGWSGWCQGETGAYCRQRQAHTFTNNCSDAVAFFQQLAVKGWDEALQQRAACCLTSRTGGGGTHAAVFTTGLSLLLLLLPPGVVAAAAAFATGLSLLLPLLQVYIPELQAAAEDVEGEDPETAWQQFGETVMARQPPEPQQQNTGRRGQAQTKKPVHNKLQRLVNQQQPSTALGLPLWVPQIHCLVCWLVGQQAALQWQACRQKSQPTTAGKPSIRRTCHTSQTLSDLCTAACPVVYMLAVAIAVPAALAGAVVALVVSKVFGWLQRRRQRRQDSDMLTASELYEDEGEPLTGSDSGQDAATAYDG